MRIPALIILSVAATSCAANNEQQSYITPTQTAINITTEEGGSSPTVRLTRDGYISEDRIVGEQLELWRLLPEAFEALGLPLPTVDPRTFSATVANHVLSRGLGGERLSNFLECGSGIEGAYADSHRITLHLSTAIAPADSAGRSIVRTRLQASARNQMHGTSGTSHCSSKGRLEMLVREELRKLSVQQRLERVRGSEDIYR